MHFTSSGIFGEKSFIFDIFSAIFRLFNVLTYRFDRKKALFSSGCEVIWLGPLRQKEALQLTMPFSINQPTVAHWSHSINPYQ